MIIFLGFGFGGLWKRRIYGYWLGLVFLGAPIVASILQLGPKLYALATVGLIESTYFVQGNRSEALIIFDLVVQSVMLGLVIVLFGRSRLANVKSCTLPRKLETHRG